MEDIKSEEMVETPKEEVVEQPKFEEAPRREVIELDVPAKKEEDEDKTES